MGRRSAPEGRLSELVEEAVGAEAEAGEVEQADQAAGPAERAALEALAPVRA
jgi:hypothetical protein